MIDHVTALLRLTNPIVGVIHISSEVFVLGFFELTLTLSAILDAGLHRRSPCSHFFNGIVSLNKRGLERSKRFPLQNIEIKTYRLFCFVKELCNMLQ